MNLNKLINFVYKNIMDTSEDDLGRDLDLLISVATLIH
jgi:hypothetical protein